MVQLTELGSYVSERTEQKKRFSMLALLLADLAMQDPFCREPGIREGVLMEW